MDLPDLEEKQGDRERLKVIPETGSRAWGSTVPPWQCTHEAPGLPRLEPGERQQVNPSTPTANTDAM